MKKSILITAILLGVISQSNAQAVIADRGEELKGWSGRTPVTLSEDAKEGKYSLQSEGLGEFRFRKVFEPALNTNLDGKSGFIGFWLFISDAEAVKRSPGFVVISSSGKLELNSHRLSFKDLDLKNGWNKVNLELSEQSNKGGEFDASHFNYFILFQKTDVPVTFKIDNIRFAKDKKDLQ